MSTMDVGKTENFVIISRYKGLRNCNVAAKKKLYKIDYLIAISTGNQIQLMQKVLKTVTGLSLLFLLFLLRLLLPLCLFSARNDFIHDKEDVDAMAKV